VIAATTHVQMLTIPALAPQRPDPRGGMLSALRRGRSRARAHDGCDPAVFAEQIRPYLDRAVRERPPAGGHTLPLEVESPAPVLSPTAVPPQEEACAAVDVPAAAAEEESAAGIAELFAAAEEGPVAGIAELFAAAVEEPVAAIAERFAATGEEAVSFVMHSFALRKVSGWGA